MIWASLATWLGAAVVIIAVLSTVTKIVFFGTSPGPVRVNFLTEYVGILAGCLLIGLTQ